MKEQRRTQSSHAKSFDAADFSLRRSSAGRWAGSSATPALVAPSIKPRRHCVRLLFFVRLRLIVRFPGCLKTTPSWSSQVSSTSQRKHNCKLTIYTLRARLLLVALSLEKSRTSRMSIHNSIAGWLLACCVDTSPIHCNGLGACELQSWCVRDVYVDYVDWQRARGRLGPV